MTKKRIIHLSILIIFSLSFGFVFGVSTIELSLDKGNMAKNTIDYQETSIRQSAEINEDEWTPMEYNPDKIIKDNLPVGVDDLDTVKYDLSTEKETLISNEEILQESELLDTNFTSEYKGIYDYMDNPTLENVHGSDDRQLVTDTTSFPWSSIAKLYMDYGSGGQYMGSGAIIDENHLLTCGHNIYQSDHGGWVESVEVIPGKDGNGNRPFGSTYATQVRTLAAWSSNEDWNHDFAVLTLNDNIGESTGWMGRQTANPSNSIYTGTLHTAGYPGDLNDGYYMYYVTDSGVSTTEYKHFYNMDTYGGQSGSPVWTYDGTNRYIVSVHAYGGTDYNSGTRLDRNKFDIINNWLEADSSGNDYPDMTKEANTAGFSPSEGGPGLTNLNTWVDIQNIGTVETGTFSVSYYASTNPDISKSDYKLGEDTVSSISATGYGSSSWSGSIPEGIPTGYYYIGWIIDEDNEITEFKEDNNDGYVSSSQILIDGTSPNNPTGCSQTIGDTTNDTWQNEVYNPYFSWFGASDSDSGIERYYYYWGSDSGGTSSTYRTYSSYDPGYLSSGTYYLRVQTEDQVGNTAPWVSLYIFRYDGIAPSNPNDCEQITGDTESGEWQEEVNDPTFSWKKVEDSHSGIAGYYVYFGSDSFGTSDTLINKTEYTPSSVSEKETYYFRIQTIDNAGNEDSWETLYIFKYGSKLMDGSNLFIPIMIISAIGVISVVAGYFVIKKRKQGARMKVEKKITKFSKSDYERDSQIINAENEFSDAEKKGGKENGWILLDSDELAEDSKKQQISPSEIEFDEDFQTDKDLMNKDESEIERGSEEKEFRFCTECGKKLPINAKFCNNCGKKTK